MAEMLLIGAAAVLTFVVVLVVMLLWRPDKGDDGDRFSNARRITTGWAADAGADPDRPDAGQPGTVDTPASTPLRTPDERGGDSSVRVIEEIPAVTEPAVFTTPVPEPAVPEPRAAEAPQTPEPSPDPATPPTPPASRRAGGRPTRA
jgi:hypothetical protein